MGNENMRSFTLLQGNRDSTMLQRCNRETAKEREKQSFTHAGGEI